MLIQASLLQQIKEWLAGSWRNPCCRCKPADTLQLAGGGEELARSVPLLMPLPQGSPLAAAPAWLPCPPPGTTPLAAAAAARPGCSRSGSCSAAAPAQSQSGGSIAAAGLGQCRAHMCWRALVDVCQSMALLEFGSVQCETCTTTCAGDSVGRG